MTEVSAKNLMLMKAWQDVQARLSENQPSQRQGTSRLFIDYAWNNFDPREISEILATPHDSYFAHKAILYDGFCAWITGPGNVNLPRHAMVLSTATHLDAAEQYGRERFEGIGQIGDIYIRTNMVGREFFEEIYYPIGGIARIARSLSRAGLRRRLASQSRGVRHALRVLSIYHHHVNHLSQDDGYGKPSLNITAGLVSAIDPAGDKLPGERAIKEYWSDHKLTIAPAYAAQSILVDEDNSLLDLILAGRSSWRKHHPLFLTWMGRSRHVVDHVLKRCAETKTATDTLEYLPDVTALPFEGPSFSAAQAENIARSYKKKR
jgi:hypothetical protein